MLPQQQQQQGETGAGVPTPPLGTPTPSQSGVDSKAELERAARRIAQLQQENELLMDMSSAL
eukprot:scaffold45629_cov14-Tisochrysis_lutea.AAC.1